LEEYVNLLRDAILIQDAVAKSEQSSALEKKVITPDTEVSALAVVLAVPEWQTQTVYKVGDQTTWNGITYVCIQAHTSVVGWEPPRTPALWVRATIEDPPDPTPSGPTNVFNLRKRSLLLPNEKSLTSIIAAPPDEGTPDGDNEKEVESLIKRHGQIKSAITELTSIDTAHIKKSVQEKGDAVDVPSNLSILKSLSAQVQYATDLRAVNIDQFRAAAARSGTNPTNPSILASVTAADGAEPGRDPLALLDTAGTASAVGLVQQIASIAPALTGVTSFEPSNTIDSAPTLTDSAPLSTVTQGVLTSFDIKPSTVGLPGKPALHTILVPFNGYNVR